MIVKNPTDKDIKVGYKGTFFSCEANGVTHVKPEVAKFWKEIHGFIIVQDGPETTPTGGEKVEAPKVETKTDASTEETDPETTENTSGHDEEKIDLESLTRAELDAIATGIGLDPKNYSNKGEVVAAINEKN